MIELVTGEKLSCWDDSAHPVHKYCPHTPSEKQREFLDLDCKEALYGGAAAGVKSEALLMGALENIHVPGYAALILRKDVARLRFSGGLIDRAQQWFAGTDASWNGREERWTFPTSGAPASISFGYMSSSEDKFRYGSSEYQYIAFDELTEFAEDDYLFMFSRLRKNWSMAEVPLQVRSATNPGGYGHRWVRRRFNTQNKSEANQTKRAFIPAKVQDNPAVNAAEYIDSLQHLPTVTRQRLMNGDWSIQEQGLIHQDWLREFIERAGKLILLNSKREPYAEINTQDCRRFVTVDPAGTSEDRAREQRGHPASYTVIQVWDMAPAPYQQCLLLRHQVRSRVGFDGLCHALKKVHKKYRPERMLIENEKLGQAAVDILGHQLPLSTIATGGKDKVARASPLINKLEQGHIFLPQTENHWKPDFETELLSWTGLPNETTDQIDAAAYAVVYAVRNDYGDLVIEAVF